MSTTGAASAPNSSASTDASGASPPGRGRRHADASRLRGPGAVAGTYGPRTRDALLAHARRGGIAATAALAGLTGTADVRPPSIAGNLVSGPYRIAGPGQIAAFLREAGVATATVGGAAGAGAILARWRPAVLPLSCRVPA